MSKTFYIFWITINVLRFNANGKIILLARIGCSTGLKNQILKFISEYKGWGFGAKYQHIIIGVAFMPLFAPVFPKAACHI